VTEAEGQVSLETDFAFALLAQAGHQLAIKEASGVDWDWLTDHLMIWRRISRISADGGVGAATSVMFIEDGSFYRAFSTSRTGTSNWLQGTDPERAAESFIRSLQAIARDTGGDSPRIVVEGVVPNYVPDFPNFDEVQ
jgi:hypothetical protein